MNKTYLKPETKVILFQIQRVLAGSLNVNGTNTFILENAQTDALSRRNRSTIWDDDDEEEE